MGKTASDEANDDAMEYLRREGFLGEDLYSPVARKIFVDGFLRGRETAKCGYSGEETIECCGCGKRIREADLCPYCNATAGK